MNKIDIIEFLKSKLVFDLTTKICFLFVLCTPLSIIIGNNLIFDRQSILWMFSTITVSSVTLFGILTAFTIFRLQSDRQETGIRQNQLEHLVEETEKDKPLRDFGEMNILEILLNKRSSNTLRIKQAIDFYAFNGKLSLAYECFFHYLEIQKLESRLENIRLKFFPHIVQLVILILISTILTSLVGFNVNGAFSNFLATIDFRKTTSFCVFYIMGFAFLTLLDITRALIDYATFHEREALDMLFDMIDRDHQSCGDSDAKA